MERPAMLVPREQELSIIIQAFVTEQYMSRYWHSAIHKYRDSAQYIIHGIKCMSTRRSGETQMEVRARTLA